MSIWATILIIAIVFGVVWSNIALLKHSAKMDMKNFNQDPIEKARRSLEEKQRAEKDQEN
ncbi:DUF2897 family protein [Pseudoalteromonas sp.]|jgi:MFS superfamily sulfate permease-like transporter|uniref:DUF2897 family protein n=1 Tax=Pseudoalteromonas sp. TaxID=53249 RepID=UPI003563A95C